jgi:cob(I)alamin adenosyltransferase
MKIYTKTGDTGTTGLFGGGRVEKNHARIESYGTVDELNAVLGLVRSRLTGDKGLEEIDAALLEIQNDLFVVGADLATPADAKSTVPRVSEAMTDRIEHLIDGVSEELAELKSFILPGGSESASRLHVARTVCRRAERRVVSAALQEAVNAEIIRYLNRLSDLLFVMARRVNQLEGVEAPEWHPRSS